MNMNNDHKSVYAAAAEVMGMTLALLTDRETSESDVERREQYIDDIVKQLMDKKPDRLITCLHCIQLHFPTIADRLLCSEIHHHLTVDVLLFQEPGLYSAHATLRSLVVLCGTVCQLTFALRPFLCRLLPDD